MSYLPSISGFLPPLMYRLDSLQNAIRLLKSLFFYRYGLHSLLLFWHPLFTDLWGGVLLHILLLAFPGFLSPVYPAGTPVRRDQFPYGRLFLECRSFGAYFARKDRQHSVNAYRSVHLRIKRLLFKIPLF